MKTHLLTALLLVMSLGQSKAMMTPKSSPATTDTIEIASRKETSWLSLQEKWQHLAHIGKMAWPANWFKDKHKADADSCLVLEADKPAEDLNEAPRFYNTLKLELGQKKVSNSLRLSWDKTKRPQQIAIFNLQGEKMMEFKLAYAGLGDLEVPVQQLLPGTYLVQVVAGNENATLPFTKR